MGVITNVNGRSRTLVEGCPTTPNLFEFQSDSDHPPQTTAEQKIANQSLASPDQHDLSTDLEELKARYAFTFGILPRGPQRNVASWLSGRIQAAQYHVMDENETTSNKPEQPGTDTLTEQIISDAHLADALSFSDQDFSTKITRATKQANDLVVNQDCIMDGNQLEEAKTTQEPVLKRRRTYKQAQHSPKRQRVSTDTLIMSVSQKQHLT
jgi:hypothetical protein